jgi:hypothetical protein
MNKEYLLEKILVPFLAALIGALIAFIYQKKLQKHQDKKYILATLMGYRHEGPNEPDFVKSLNMIDIVYHDNKKVKELLHKYLTYTGSAVYSGGQIIEVFFDLLLAMGRDIGYRDLKHNEIKDFYCPAVEVPQQPRKEDEPLKS